MINRPQRLNKRSQHRPKEDRLQDSGEPQSLLDSTGFLLARLGMESRRRFARMMARHELSTHHFGLLLALGERRVLPQQQLGRIIGVDPRNAVTIIDELEARGLISRRAHAQDRRRYDVLLTPTGVRMIYDLRRDGTKLEKEMLKPLFARERTILHSLLLKLFLGIEVEP